ncbi:LLM class flavin-dependent oxidoreductase [Pseudonocardia sp. GCM10023141]|uniref:LLM class flavin-dependent oxidoreductase n=1 Tax=Pseudonocardia sp. GCM10023141 TaxID=3252653 RepID=UPI003612E497
MARIKFGIFPITEDWPDGADMARVYNEIVAEARLAESVGFDSCLITEHHQQADGYFPNPLMVSAGVARSTTTLKVGSCVALAPLYNPIRLTEDAALLDVISGGRLILGLGASYVSEDLAAFGVDVSQRGALMEDTVRFLQEAWTHDNLDFDGEVFHFKNMRVTPKPVQQPRPPVWLGAWTPQGLRRAGRLGDAWVTDVINTLPTFKMFAEIYRKSAEKAGKTPSIAVLRECWVAPSTDQALEEYAEHLMTSHKFYYEAGGYSPLVDPWITDLTSTDEFTYDKVSPDRFIIGSPEHCISEIERWNAELGSDYFVMRFRHPTGPTHEKALASIKLFGEKVIPAFA